MILKQMLNQSAQLDLMFQALADPSRRAMLDRMCKGPASVSDLAVPFEMSLPAVLQHLQVLEQSGLVKTEKVGRVRTCSVETKALRSVEQWVSARRTMWEARFDRLGVYLAEEAQAGKRKRPRENR
jgi:DNA-binding transcriptional ArsR family regulator